MPVLRTRRNNQTVAEYLSRIKNEAQQADCQQLVEWMKEITQAEPKMWGPSIVGFGSYHYVYASGQEGDWPLTGFSPRKDNITIYIMDGVAGYEPLIEKLGKCKVSKTCIYVKKLEDVHATSLKTLIKKSVGAMRKMYP